VTLGANTVTLPLQRIQLLTHRDRYGLAPWSTTGNRSAKPTFQFKFREFKTELALS
jgi:hypothetical protein